MTDNAFMGVSGSVFLLGPAGDEIVQTEPNGTFFKTGLAPGEYIAIFPFGPDSAIVDFKIKKGQQVFVSLMEPLDAGMNPGG